MKRPGLCLEIILLGFIIIMAVALWPVSGITIANNGAKYLQQAADILNGAEPEMLFGDTGTTRGPLYPMFLAGSLKVGGRSISCAVVVTRLFLVLSIVMTYVLGRLLYGRFAGVWGAILVSTSYGINMAAASIDTDIVLPAFVLTFMALCYQGLARRSVTLAVMSGVMLGLGFLVKESAILFIVVPVASVILAGNTERLSRLKLLVACVGGAMLSLVPWTLHTLCIHGSVLPMLGVFHPGIQKACAADMGQDNTLVYWILLCTIDLWPALVGFYRQYLVQVTPLAPLMVFGALIVIARACIRRTLSDVVLAGGIVSFMPVILRIGRFGDSRIGQTTITYMLMYVSLAAAISLMTGWIHGFACGRERWQGWSAMVRVAVVLCAVMLLFAQLFSGGIMDVAPWAFVNRVPSTGRVWTSGSSALAIANRGDFEVHGRFTEAQRLAAEWLREHAPSGSVVVADGYSNQAMKFFGVRGQVPAFHPEKGVNVHDLAEDAEPAPDDDIAMLFLYSKFRKPGKATVVYLISQSEIINTLSEDRADWLVLSYRGAFFGKYFDVVPWARRVYEQKDVSVYKIDREAMCVAQLEGIFVNEDIGNDLEWLRNQREDEFCTLTDHLDRLGIRLEDLTKSQKRILQGTYY